MCGLDTCDAIDGVCPESRMGASYSSLNFSYSVHAQRHQAVVGESQGRAAGPDKVTADASCILHARNSFKGGLNLLRCGKAENGFERYRSNRCLRACYLVQHWRDGAAVWTVHESRRPQLVAFLERVRDKSCVLFVIENFGTGVASDIEISGFNYALAGECERRTVGRSFVKTGIPMLVPSARRGALLLCGPGDMGKRLGASCTVTLSYSERGLLGRPKHREEEFLLDMDSFGGCLYTMSDFPIWSWLPRAWPSR